LEVVGTCSMFECRTVILSIAFIVKQLLLIKHTPWIHYTLNVLCCRWMRCSKVAMTTIWMTSQWSIAATRTSSRAATSRAPSTCTLTRWCETSLCVTWHPLPVATCSSSTASSHPREGLGCEFPKTYKLLLIFIFVYVLIQSTFNKSL